MEMNPYAAPHSNITPLPFEAPDSAEAIRREHINTEAAIKSAGVLYYLGGFGILLVAGTQWVESASRGRSEAAVIGGLLVVVCLVYGWIGYGLRRLRTWARIPATIFCSLGLIGFPVGTLINIYILVKMHGKQGKFVMSPEYQQIIAATPHVKRKTSRALLIVLLVLVLVLLFVGFVVPLFR